MEGIKSGTAFARLVAEALGDGQFTLVDVGCSSGIDAAWRVFQNRLRAFAFDPNLDEVARLIKQETLPGVKYVAAFVGVDAADAGRKRLDARDFWGNNPWERLSVARSLTRRTGITGEMGVDEKTKLNFWNDVRLADPGKPVVLSNFLRENEAEDVDFVKIDVDGADFLILRSLAPMMDEAGVLGVGIEVNFHGSDDPDVHTFHNVDRLMKRSGFELFALSTRPYSMAALPAPYQLPVPAQTVWGRILQGDALYFRDAAAPEQGGWAKSAGESKVLKLAALFSMAGLPDNAAEVLLRFRPALERVFDVQAGLDALTAQCIPEGEPVPSYADYMKEFEADGNRFYPAVGGASAHELADALRAVDAEPELSSYDELCIDAAEIQFTMQDPGRSTVWPIRLQTPVEPWAYAAVLPIPTYTGSGDIRHAIVRIRTTVVEGEVWIGALTLDEKDFLRRHMIPKGAGNCETVLAGVNLGSVSKLIIENGSESVSSNVTVECASVLIPRPRRTSYQD